MADEVIVLDVNINAEQSNQTLSGLNGKLDQLKQQLMNTEIGSEAFKKLSKEISATETKIINATQAMKGLGKEELYGKIGQFAGGLSAAFSGLFLVMGSGNKTVQELQKNLNIAVGVVMAVKGAMEAATASTQILKAAQIALNNVIKANPIGLIATAIIAATAAMIAFANTISDTVKLQNAQVDLNASILKSIQEQKKGLEFYTTVAKDTARTEKERKIALENIKEITGGVINVQDLSAKSLKKLDEQTNIYIETLLKKAKVQAAEQKIIELSKSNIDLEAEIIKERNDIYSKNLMTLAFSGGPLEALKMAGHTIKSVTDIINGTDPEKIDGLYKIIADNRTKDLVAQQQLNNKTMEALQIYVNENKKIVNLKKDTGKVNEKRIKTNVEEIKGRKDNIAVIQEEYDKLLKLPEVLEKDTETRNKYLSETKESYMDEYEAYKKYLELVGANGEFGKSLKAKQELLEWQLQEELDVVKDNEELKEQIRKEYAKRQKQLIIDEVRTYTVMTSKIILSTISTINQFQAQQTEQALATLDKQYNAANELYKDQLDRKLITQEEYDKKVKEAEEARIKEEQQLKHDAWEKDRAAKIITTTINGIVGAIAQYEAGPLGLILSAVVAAEAVAAVALLASQQNPYAKGGILNGPSHANGGIATPYGELEGGEAVINKKSTAMFLPQLSAINQMGGGTNFGGNTLRNANTISTTTIDDNSLQKIVDAIVSIPVVNVATETEAVNSKIRKIKNKVII